MRVLVVSEDATVRLRAGSALRLHAGAEVVEAVGADDLRDLVLRRGERFDVLVVDGDLKPRGGYASLYDLRAHADLHGASPMPALVLADRAQDAWLTSWAGANDLLLKPVDSFELARRVQGLVGAEVPPYGGATNTSQQVAAALRPEAAR